MNKHRPARQSGLYSTFFIISGKVFIYRRMMST
ncbi:MAG: sortase B protein-sorting domain-containing protein [Candidatus Krumholzibacteriota bacterium]|nr:sortase B protein-sorting domain-containing protein [Candidatus Krumholzibacteriota bacterium]